MTMSLSIRVLVEEGGWLLPVPRPALQASLRAMLEAAGEAHHQLELYVVRDGRMAEENLLHMACTGPTNILSFPAEEVVEAMTPHAGLSGLVSEQQAAPAMLLLSVDTLRRECLLYGQEAEQHTLRLLAHGLGHVLGHDHGPVMDALCRRMWVAGGAACGLELTTEAY